MKISNFWKLKLRYSCWITSKIKFLVLWAHLWLRYTRITNFFAGFVKQRVEGRNLRPNSEIYVQKGTILSKIYVQGFFRCGHAAVSSPQCTERGPGYARGDLKLWWRGNQRVRTVSIINYRYARQRAKKVTRRRLLIKLSSPARYTRADEIKTWDENGSGHSMVLMLPVFKGNIWKKKKIAVGRTRTYAPRGKLISSQSP